MVVVKLIRISLLAVAGILVSAIYAEEVPNTDATRSNNNALVMQGEQADQGIQGDAGTETENWMKWEKQLKDQLDQLADKEKKAVQDEQKAAQALTAAREAVDVERAKPTKQDDLFAEQKKIAELEKVAEHCQKQDLDAAQYEHQLELDRLSKQVDLWAIKALLKPTQPPPFQNSQSLPGSNP